MPCFLLKIKKEPFLYYRHFLLNRDCIEVVSHNLCRLTKTGENFIELFTKRHTDFIEKYEIFSCVDIKSHNFASEYYKDFETYTEWQNFTNHKRWLDLRVAVAEYYQLDITEIIFINYLLEVHLYAPELHDEKKIITGEIWDEIQTICNCSLRLHSNNYKNRVSIDAHLLEELLKKSRYLSKQSMPLQDFAPV